MGDPSWLRFVPDSSSAIPIDWTRVPEETKTFLIINYLHDRDTLPATIGDLAEMFHETKFFGYFNSEVEALKDISEFGLQPTPSTLDRAQVGPRFYMAYLEKVWFLLFTPGTRECILGYSKNSVWDSYDEDDAEEVWEKVAADETAMAHAFDVKLEQEASQRRGEMVEFIQSLGGWTVWMLGGP